MDVSTLVIKIMTLVQEIFMGIGIGYISLELTKLIARIFKFIHVQ